MKMAEDPPQAHLHDLSFPRRRESRFVRRRISLDTRFRGYDGLSWPLRHSDYLSSRIF